jgi:hypothetical protein
MRGDTLAVVRLDRLGRSLAVEPGREDRQIVDRRRTRLSRVRRAIAHFERRAEGVTSANGIAKALNERDIATPRGGK